MNIENLYNKILTDSRNPEIFNKYINENLSNKLLIFFIYLSKIFNNMSQKNKNYQIFFDYIFNRIEGDFRELGYGDMSVNKKMKIIVTKFYSILLDFKNFANNSDIEKIDILLKYFSQIEQIEDFIKHLDRYFAIDNVEHNDI